MIDIKELEEIIATSLDFPNMLAERDSLNCDEDYDGAFEIECNLRDDGAVVADFIVRNKDYLLESARKDTYDVYYKYRDENGESIIFGTYESAVDYMDKVDGNGFILEVMETVV